MNVWRIPLLCAGDFLKQPIGTSLLLDIVDVWKLLSSKRVPSDIDHPPAACSQRSEAQRTGRDYLQGGAIDHPFAVMDSNPYLIKSF